MIKQLDDLNERPILINLKLFNLVINLLNSLILYKKGNENQILDSIDIERGIT